MKSNLFDYELPKGRIAQAPSARRDQSRLLLVDRKTERLSHHRFDDFPELIPSRCNLFRNNAMVMKARLKGRRPTGGAVHCLLLRPAGPPGEWWCLLKPGRKMKEGVVFGLEKAFSARVREKSSTGEYRVHFETGRYADVMKMAEAWGAIPLPPYIRRSPEEKKNYSDGERYQTVYAKENQKVAAAAPTAGLHFTPETLRGLESRKISSHDLTLHIGLDTFRPIQTENIESHPIHSEYYEIPVNSLEALRAGRGKPVLAIGTTTARALEDYGRKGPHEGFPNGEAIRLSFRSKAELFIYPPSEFTLVDALLTNFHLPRSTLLCLVAAFLKPGDISGIKWLKEIYREAIALNYRFFSYGDAMLIL